MSFKNDKAQEYIATAEKVKLENIRQWVKDFFQSQGCSVTPSGHLLISGRRIENSKFLADVRLEYDYQYKKANRNLSKEDKIAAPSNSVLDAAIDTYIDELWWNHLQELKLKIQYVEENNSESLERFILACTGTSNLLQINVVAHWIWQVKRKIFNLPVKNHIMPVFSGPQGSGKSTALNILTSPLKDYRLDWNLQALGDDRNYHGISKNFIILFDEMMGCNKTDIETLKHFITAEKLNARKLYTNQVDFLLQNCSCLGTSNKHLDILIRDETGMRRFVEIKSIEKMNWELLNSIDPISIWNAVNENNDSGYLYKVADLLKEEQESYRYQDSVESYLQDTNAMTGDRTQKISNEKLFQDYVDWCKFSEERPLSKQLFGRRLKSFSFLQERSSSERSYLMGKSFVLWGMRHASKIKEDLLDFADQLVDKKS